MSFFPFCLHIKLSRSCSMFSKIFSQGIILLNKLHSQLYMPIYENYFMYKNGKRKAKTQKYFCGKPCPSYFVLFFFTLIFTWFFFFPFSKWKVRQELWLAYLLMILTSVELCKFTPISRSTFSCFVYCYRKSVLNNSNHPGQKHCHTDYDEMMT